MTKQKVKMATEKAKTAIQEAVSAKKAAKMLETYVKLQILT